MTVLQTTIKRKLPRPIERDEWAVEIGPVGISFRQPRGRTRYDVSWDAVWRRAMEIAAATAQREKREEKELRRATR